MTGRGRCGLIEPSDGGEKGRDMAEDDRHIETQRIGTATEDGVDLSDLSAAEGCADLVNMVMRNVNTLPGPDEEIEIQLVRRKRAPDALRDVRQIRDVRIEREQQQ